MNTLTQAARNAIRESGLPIYEGYDFMFTNKYKNCRTVKAYIKGKVTAEQIEKAVSFVEANVPGASAKALVDSNYSYGRLPSFIVRVPIDY